VLLHLGLIPRNFLSPSAAFLRIRWQMLRAAYEQRSFSS